jgi:hypothetical protein
MSAARDLKQIREGLAAALAQVVAARATVKRVAVLLDRHDFAGPDELEGSLEIAEDELREWLAVDLEAGPEDDDEDEDEDDDEDEDEEPEE